MMTSEAKTKTETRVYRRIATRLRGEIGRRFRPGDAFPSERELAERFSVHRLTVRQALEVLAGEGLIRRQHGRATVVLDRNGTGEIAIAMAGPLLSAATPPYYRVTTHALMQAVKARNPQWSVGIHVAIGNRDGEEFAKVLDLLEPDVLKRLRGVFTFHSLGDLETTLWARQVPVVTLSIPERASQRCCVWFDHRTIYQRGIQLLREAGCRTVGVIWKGNPSIAWTQNPAYRCFVPILQRHGLETRPEWIEPAADTAHEQAGHDRLIRLWRHSPHPDGILVNDDILCRGVLRAVLQLGIDLPSQLRLVTHANRDLDLPYHQPVTRVEFDPAEQARQAANLMVALLRGEKPSVTRIRLLGVAVQGETT